MANVSAYPKQLSYKHAALDGTGHLMPVHERPSTPFRTAPAVDWLAEVMVAKYVPYTPAPPTPEQHRLATRQRAVIGAQIGAVVGLWGGAIPAWYLSGATQSLARGLFMAYGFSAPIMACFTLGPNAPDDAHGSQTAGDAGMWFGMATGVAMQAALYGYLGG